MRIWDEEQVLKQLRAERQAPRGEERNSKSNNQGQQVAFLLILVRKFAQKHYEFLFLPASCYNQVEQIYLNTIVVADNGKDNGENVASGVWIGQSAKHIEENEEGFQISSSFKSSYVGKAIFHTASGEPLMKMEGTTGWKEALKQKYHNLDAKSRAKEETTEQQQERLKNRKTVKAVAAVALGGAGGTSLAASMAAANSVAAAGVVTAEAVGTGGVAAGGMLQTVGAVGIMASPVGMTVAAAGAIGGLYYVMHRRNQAKQKLNSSNEHQEIGKETERGGNAVKEETNTVATEEESSEEGGGHNNYYEPLRDGSETDLPSETDLECWVNVFAKRVDCEDSGSYTFVPTICPTKNDAEQEWLALASNTVAKALFSPDGKVYRVEVDSGDHDGWETALALHFDFLLDHGMITAIPDGEDSAEDTPLLEEEPAQQPPTRQRPPPTKTDSWLIDTIRKKRQHFGRAGVPFGSSKSCV